MGHLFSDPEFYVLLAVAIFLIVVWKPMRRAVVGALDSRAERIRQELDAARNLRDEAQHALVRYPVLEELLQPALIQAGERGGDTLPTSTTFRRR